MELNLSKAAKRKRAGVLQRHERQQAEGWVSIRREIDDPSYSRKRYQPVSDMQHNSLLRMFNEELVEHVRYSGGEYVPVVLPVNATHELRATAWNTEPTPAMPDPIALAVCAIPLRPKIKATNIQIRKPIPRRMVVYKHDGGLLGKQAVLRALVLAMKARVPLKALPRLTEPECDRLYANLHRASSLLKLRRLMR